MGLGDGGHPVGPLPGREGGQIGAVGGDAARVFALLAHDALEKRGLAHAVGAQDGQQLSGFGGEGQLVEHWVLPIAEAHVFHGQTHSFSSFRMMR